MPNDAKFGLIAGLAIVIAIAVVYLRGQPSIAPGHTREPAASVHPSLSGPAGPNRPVKGKTTSQGNDEGRMTNDERMTKPE
jgi:hypothetical protein